MLDTLDLDAYLPHVGSLFHTDAQQALELVAVAPGPRPRNPAAGRAGFALTFRGDTAAALAQGLHALTHPALGAGALFMVPIGPLAGGMAYEAIFN